MSGFIYPYNPGADMDACIIKNEVLRPADNPNRWNCIIPIAAPFFRESLVIIDDTTGLELREGVDYYLGHYSKEINQLTKYRAYGSVMLITPVAGTVTFKQYMTIGGSFNVRLIDIENYLAQLELPDPRNEDWAVLAKYVRLVEPITIPLGLEDAISKDLVTKSLDGLVTKLEELNEMEATAFAAVFTRIKQLGLLIDKYDLVGHQFKHNPHRLTYSQLGALHKDGIAVNALTAYGHTLATLVSFIRRLGITEKNVDLYYELLGGVFQGRLSVKTGEGFRLQNVLGTSIINFESGDINILAENNVSLEASTTLSIENEGLVFGAGNNQLSIHSSLDTTGVKTANYNGCYLIHVGNLNDLLPKISSNIAPILDLTLANGTDTILTGGGTIASPLTGYVTFPDATTVKAGMVKLAPVINTNSDEYAATSSDLLALMNQLNAYIPSARKVQGNELTADITFTKANIGLGNVDNTDPSNSVNSTAFTNATNGKAVIGHHHDLTTSDLLPDANPYTYGVMQLTSTYDPDDTEKAATPKLAKPFNTRYEDQKYLGDNKVTAKFVHVAEFGTRDTPPLMWIDGVNIVVSLDARLYYKSFSFYFHPGENSVDMYTAYTALYAERVGYVYLSTPNDELTLTVGPYTDDITTGAGLFKVGIITLDPTPTVTPLPFVRLFNVVELEHHYADNTAHNLLGNLKKLLGLTNVQNLPISDTVSFPSFLDIFNTWYRFSHDSTGTYPAVASELTAWAYDDTTKQITNTTNSNTFIGTVSTDTFGDYEFEVEVSSTSADDDWAGIVLAYYKDPLTAKEHTLSLMRVLGLSNTQDYDTLYIYNYAQSDKTFLRTNGSRRQLNWSTAGKTRLYAKRVGNVISCKVYQFSGLDATEALCDSYDIDLTSDPKLAVFLGESRYGYCCYSQQNTTWNALKRPDDDSRYTYASMKALRTVRDLCASKAIIVKGTIKDGQTIPLPVGFTADEVKCVIVPKTSTEAFYSYYGYDKYTFSVDADRKVTASWEPYGNLRKSMTVYYYLVGVKS